MAFNSSFSSTQTEGAIAKVIQAIALPDSILSITSETSSSELNAALGGANGFNDLIEKIQSGAINQGIITTSDGHLASIPVSIHTDVAKTKINIFVQHNGAEKYITITNTDGALSAEVSEKSSFQKGRSKSGIVIDEDGNPNFVNGSDVESSGEYAYAEGYKSKAIDQEAHAEGYFGYASAFCAHAGGFNSVASKRGAFASGAYISSILIEGEANATTYTVKGIFSTGNNMTFKSCIVPGKVIFTMDGDTFYPQAIIVSISDQEDSFTITLDKTLNAEAAVTTSNVYRISASVASGYGAHSENSVASGDYSHAEGVSVSSGVYSHSEGQLNVASGQASHAEGYKTIASGKSAHTEGERTVGSNYNSHAEGWYSEASGDTSHAEGNRTEASGKNSHSSGHHSVSSGENSYSEGEGVVSSGKNSHAEGGFYAGAGLIHLTGDAGATTYSVDNIPEEIIVGKTVICTGIGDSNISKKIVSIDSEAKTINCEETFSSDQALSSNPASIYLSSATGSASHAEGGGFAIGDASHSEGIGTVARNDAEHAEGLYNKSVESEDASIATIHTVGIGSSLSDRKNAHEVKKNGDTYIMGIGGYDGTNADEETTKSLQSVLSSNIDFGSLVETQLNYPADTTIPGTFYYKIRSIDGSAYSGLILYEIFNYEGTLFKNGVFYNTHNNGVIQYDYFEIDGKVIKMSITLNSGEATVQSEILMSQKVLTENEYAALGEAVNTDNTLYFVTPDN